MNLFKRRQKQPEITSKELIKRVQVLEERVQNLQHAVSKIGIVRFNPFHEMGGDQSFSIALLDETHNGLVMTSYYGRDLNRVYAKPIQHGTSEYELSDEEKQAIRQAIGLENPKSKPQNSK